MVCKIFLLRILRYSGKIVEKKKIEKTGKCKAFWYWNKRKNSSKFIKIKVIFLKNSLEMFQFSKTAEFYL